MITVSAIRSPKRRVLEKDSRANWFRYYAGFSEGFVEDTIAELALRDGDTLLDPWLGAGTTAQVATAKGYRIRGCDLNPAMLLVAKARTLATSAGQHIPTLTEAIFRRFERSIRRDKKSLPPASDPLEQWLQPAAARAFRLLEQSAAATVSEREPSLITPIWNRADRAAAILAFFYVGLFRALRGFISEFQSSNPTWVKVSDGKGRIHLSPARIVNSFCEEIGRLLRALRSEAHAMPVVSRTACVLKRCSSLELPLSPRSIDAVISSPPYCTRIDYVRATLPELAIIGYPHGDAIRKLRERMIGTPTINKVLHYDSEAWGSTCSRLLSLVQDHPSKASSTYYIKYYRQYFASIYASLGQIDRALKASGRCVLVVQDSYYKDVRIDLPLIFIEMANELGWDLHKRVDFHVKRTLAGINPEVKQYRDVFQATESVLWFYK